MYEVWIGTPNELEKRAARDTQTAAVRWARDYLSGMEVQARKFDNAALDDIRRVKDELGQTANLTMGATRRWEFPYISITFVIELRRT